MWVQWVANYPTFTLKFKQSNRTTAFLEYYNAWIPKCPWQNPWEETQPECLDPWVVPPAEGDSESSYNCRAGKTSEVNLCISIWLYNDTDQLVDILNASPSYHLFKFLTHNFNSSVCSSSSSPATLLSYRALLFKVFCLASLTKGLTKFVRSVQQRHSRNTSSSSCSLVWGRGSLATWSSTEDRVMPRDDALRLPRLFSTKRQTRTTSKLEWWTCLL